ncbi:unnamed protein product [Rotaria sordida]|uniref:Uncharacterized protein n=2 Tax=Rotaria sordida TaxID=392033 RepID=A0A814G840_9BILA|nr:unnamed protein product [Rotaria sordida]CAF1388350.1 unnamed protein product [Rotaria sordida]
MMKKSKNLSCPIQSICYPMIIARFLMINVIDQLFEHESSRKNQRSITRTRNIGTNEQHLSINDLSNLQLLLDIINLVFSSLSNNANEMNDIQSTEKKISFFNQLNNFEKILNDFRQSLVHDETVYRLDIFSYLTSLNEYFKLLL